MANEKWIILHMQFSHRLEKFLLSEISEIAATDEEDNLMVFNSLNEASDYQEKHGISGQCISLPLYD